MRPLAFIMEESRTLKGLNPYFRLLSPRSRNAERGKGREEERKEEKKRNKEKKKKEEGDDCCWTATAAAVRLLEGDDCCWTATTAAAGRRWLLLLVPGAAVGRQW